MVASVLYTMCVLISRYPSPVCNSGRLATDGGYKNVWEVKKQKFYGSDSRPSLSPLQGIWGILSTYYR